jgi:hypothetical protein
MKQNNEIIIFQPQNGAIKVDFMLSDENVLKKNYD